jgi:hypothetical protein
MKPLLKAPGTKRLKLKSDEPVSSSGFNFNLRHYTLGREGPDPGREGPAGPEVPAGPEGRAGTRISSSRPCHPGGRRRT